MFMVRFWTQIYRKWSITRKIFFWISVFSIICAIIFGRGYFIKNIVIGNENTQINIDKSNISNSPITIENINQKTEYNVYGWSDLDKIELCSLAVSADCYSPKIKDQEDFCRSNITSIDNGIVGKSILIDGCDILVIKPEDILIKSGTISLLTEFKNYSLNQNRFLFDAFDEYDKNRISLYLQPDGFLTFSLFDSDRTSISMREKLTKEDLNSWMQIAITWEEYEGVLKLFINGKVRKSRKLIGISFDGGFKGILIGSDIYGKNQAHAIIDEVRISSIARSSSYINQIYQNLIGTEGYGNLLPEETIN